LNKRPPKDGEKQQIINTLLVDGNALFKFGFFGAKGEYNHRGEHIGGLYQFLTILRKLLTEDLYHRVYVFWDGNLSGKLRFNLYPEYKGDRDKDYINGTHPTDASELQQREKIWSYLDELCIKQLMDDVVESDDFIAYYCKQREPNEKITICTLDRDLSQLIEENVRIYFCDLKAYITPHNYSEFFPHYYENIGVIKIIAGDTSDTIKGIKGVKEKTLLNLFPELTQFKVTLDQIIERAKVLQEERINAKKPPLKSLDNIVNGVTDGCQGDKFYEINTKIINLKEPLITESAINKINDLIDGKLDSSNRTIKEVYDKMKKDGLERTIGPTRYPEYLLPFKKFRERQLKNEEIV